MSQTLLDAVPALLEIGRKNDEIKNLHDLLGKANALARIRAERIKEIEEQLFNAEQQVIKAEKSRDCALSIAETHSDQWNEAVLALEASQAREAKLRDFIFDYVDLEPNNEAMIVRYDTCVKPTDDTALREYRKKVLLEAADAVDYGSNGVIDVYRRIAKAALAKVGADKGEKE